MRYIELLESKDQDFSHGRFVALAADDETKANLVNFNLVNQIPNGLKMDEFHVTLAHSKKDFPCDPQGYLDTPIVVDPKEFFWEVFQTGEDANCLVLRFDNAEINRRNKELADAGAVSDFPSFKSHVSMSYNIGDMNIKTLRLPDFPLVFDREFQEPLSTD